MTKDSTSTGQKNKTAKWTQSNQEEGDDKNRGRNKWKKKKKSPTRTSCIAQEAAQCGVAAWVGEEFGGGWIRVCADSVKNQGQLDVVKQEMARVNIGLLGISELKWTRMGEFNSDDHSRGASQAALVVRNLPVKAGDARDVGLIPGWGRPSGVGNGNSLQNSCLENLMDREARDARILQYPQIN